MQSVQVGATMEAGSLPEPFRARFEIEEVLVPYAGAELAEIVRVRAGRLGFEASPEACAAVARRARGTPRMALTLLRRARDRMQAGGAGCPGDPARIEAEHVEEAARRLGIDDDGLRAEDLEILRVLAARGRPMGIEALAATLRMDSATLRHVHEPYLLEQDYIIIHGSRGREATRKARARVAAA